MSRIKKILLVIAIIFLLLITGVIVFFLLLDLNDYKDTISQEFQKETGYVLQLQGDLDHSIFPWLGVAANGIVVQDPQSTEEAPLFEAKVITIRAKLLPLFFKELVVDTVEIDSPDFYLPARESSQSAKENNDTVDDIADDTSDESVNDSDGLFTAFELDVILLGGINIQNASVYWKNTPQAEWNSIDQINLSSDQYTPGQEEAVAMQLTGKINSKVPEVTGDLTLSTNIFYRADGEEISITELALDTLLNSPLIPGNTDHGKLRIPEINIDLAEASASVPQFTLDTLNTRANANLDIQNGDEIDELKLRMRLELDGEDITLPFRLLGIETMSGKMPDDKKQFNVDVDLNMDMESGELMVNTLQASLLGAQIEGNVKASNLLDDDRVAAKGKFSAKGDDLPALLQLTEGFVADSSLKETIRQLSQIEKYTDFAANTEFDIDMAQGKLSLPGLQANAVGITLDGKLEGSGTSNTDFSATGPFSLISNDLKPLLVALGYEKIADNMKEIAINSRLTFTPEEFNISPATIQTQYAEELVTAELSAVIDFEEKSAQLDLAKLDAFGTRASGEVRVSDSDGNTIAAGKVKVDKFNPRRLLTTMNVSIAETTGEEMFTSLTISEFTFTTDSNKLMVNPLRAKLDQTEIAGTLTATELDEEIATYSFSLNLGKMDLDSYLSSIPALPLTMLQQFNTDGIITAEKLTISELDFQPAKITVLVANGKLQVEPTATLYNGSLTGNLEIDASQKNALVATDITLTNINMGMLSSALGGRFDPDYTGEGNIIMQLNSQGNTVAALRGNLTGDGTVAVTDGKLYGVNVQTLFEEVATAIREQRKGFSTFAVTRQTGNPGIKRISGKDFRGTGPNEETPFDSFQATLRITDGVVRSDDLMLNAANLQVRGGIEDNDTLIVLKDDTWDYNFTTSVIPELVIRCNEKVADLICRPTPKSIFEMEKKLLEESAFKGFSGDEVPALDNPE